MQLGRLVTLSLRLNEAATMARQSVMPSALMRVASVIGLEL